MKPKRLLIATLIAALIGPVLPATSATAGAQVSSDASIDYFVALNAEIEDFDSREASDFTTFSDSLNKTLRQEDALARATVRQTASVNLAPGGTLDGASASASMNGSATKSENPDFVTVSSPTAQFSLNFGVGTEAQYALSPSLSASNSDSDDCSSAEITLSGPVSFYRETHAGGDCGTFDPPTGSSSGILPPGEYSLNVEGEVSMAGEDASASGSASYGVALWIFPPCDVTGDPGDNVLTGTADNDVICGFGGNDTIDGAGGNDIITADEGDDIVQGGAGLDQIIGGPGHDTIRGGPGTDLLVGAEGNDRIFGDDGSESSIANPPNAGLLGGPGNDSLNGGRGSDNLVGSDGADDLRGGDGNDELDGGNGADDLFGGADADKLVGGIAQDVLVGDAGSDRLSGGVGNDDLRGGAGSDRVLGDSGDDDVLGGSGDDTQRGGFGDDRIIGGGGNDDMFGEAGRDFFNAKDGEKDTLSGGPDRDRARKDRRDDASGIEVFL